MQLRGHLKHGGEMSRNLSLTAPGKEPHQILLPPALDTSSFKLVHNGMANADGRQTSALKHLLLKREEAEHQIDPVCHAMDPSPVPGPDLGADVIDQPRR